MRLISAALIVLSAVPASAESVRGLSVTLTAPRTSWTLGGVVELDATLTNVGDRPFLIDTFGELDGLYQGKRASNVIPSCWALTWENQPAPPGPTGRPMTLDRGQFVLLKPGETHTKHLSIALAGVAPGRYRIRLAYVPRAAGPSFSFPNRWEEQQKLFEPMWLGMAYSDPLTVDVVGS